jgi:hypothetical protein
MKFIALFALFTLFALTSAVTLRADKGEETVPEVPTPCMGFKGKFERAYCTCRHDKTYEEAFSCINDISANLVANIAMMSEPEQKFARIRFSGMCIQLYGDAGKPTAKTLLCNCALFPFPENNKCVLEAHEMIENGAKPYYCRAVDSVGGKIATVSSSLYNLATSPFAFMGFVQLYQHFDRVTMLKNFVSKVDTTSVPVKVAGLLEYAGTAAGFVAAPALSVIGSPKVLVPLGLGVGLYWGFGCFDYWE